MMGNLILTHTAVKSVRCQAHSPHKIPACDTLGLPSPIEPAEFIPINRDRLPACILALCLSNLDTLTLSLFELFTLQLREGSKHCEHKFPRRRVGVDVFFVADERYPIISKGVNDVQQVLCGAPQTADTENDLRRK